LEPSMCGNSMPENREIPVLPLHGGEGRPVKAIGRTTGMHAAGKSDRPVVPGKPANKTTCDGRGGVGGGKGFWPRGRRVSQEHLERSIECGPETAVGVARADKSTRSTSAKDDGRYPSQRFCVNHPRQEPYDLMGHVRICAGGRP
jgi:hypothetical protein